MEQSGSSPGS